MVVSQTPHSLPTEVIVARHNMLRRRLTRVGAELLVIRTALVLTADAMASVWVVALSL